jgi:hypothetical protein
MAVLKVVADGARVQAVEQVGFDDVDTIAPERLGEVY